MLLSVRATKEISCRCGSFRDVCACCSHAKGSKQSGTRGWSNSGPIDSARPLLYSDRVIRQVVSAYNKLKLDKLWVRIVL